MNGHRGAPVPGLVVQVEGVTEHVRVKVERHA